MKITVQTKVNASIEKVWEYWTKPKHIMNWNNASDDWYTPNATNELIVDGKFNYIMASKDGSMSFDFWGIYTKIIPMQKITYTLGDDRAVEINFETTENQIVVTEIFEAETENTIELQQQGWQAILNNFKEYTENN